MKAEELMVGDYLTFRDALKDNNLITVKVVIIYGATNEILASVDGDPTLDRIDIYDELCGIPLTPEILEKNGFVYNDLPFVQAWEQFGLELYSGGNGYRIGCGNNVALIIDSVHQLQHALRLCGIEKEIVL